MGFDDKVILLFMSCVSLVHYRISHDGRVFSKITPTHGLRQGDPPSSYLFLICIERFTSLISAYERQGLVLKIKVARNAPHISHIFFADDCYIFCKAGVESANYVLEMLKVFETAPVRN